MKEYVNMQGRLLLQLSNRDGQIVQQQRVKNRIVTTGRMLVAEHFTGQSAGDPPEPVSHMAVGEGGTAATDADMALETPRGDRNPITGITTETFNDGGIARVRVTLQTVFDFGQVNNPAVPLREAGIFTDVTGSVMYNRVVFEPVTKTDSFRLTLFWEIIF